MALVIQKAARRRRKVYPATLLKLCAGLFLLMLARESIAVQMPQTISKQDDPAIFHVGDYRAVSPRITQADAAFRAASSWVATHGQGAILDLGSRRWEVCNDGAGWVLPQAPDHQGGLSIAGSDVQDAQLVLSCAVHRAHGPETLVGELSQAFLWQPTLRPALLNTYRMHDFTLEMQGNAQACMDMLGLVYVASFTNITCSGAAGPDHGIRFGDHLHPAEAWSFQTFLTNLETTPGAAQGAGARVRADVSNGSVQLEIEDGGTGYSHATRAWLIGYGVHSEPCAVTPPLAATIQNASGQTGPDARGRITAIRAEGVAQGCKGPAWVAVYDPVYPVRYGILLDNWTDSTAYDLQPDSGYAAALWLNSSSDVMVHTHPCCGMPLEIRDSGTNTWLGTELDSPAHYGFVFDRAASPSLFGTNFFWNTLLPGSSGYLLGPDVKYATFSGGNCTNLQDAGGYHQLVLPEGPIDAGTSTPYGVSLYGERPCVSGATGTDLVARPQPATRQETGSARYTFAISGRESRVAPGACLVLQRKLTRPAQNVSVQITAEGDPGDSFTWDAYLTGNETVALRLCNRGTVPAAARAGTFHVYLMSQ
ncbi:hypothetical protein [Acidipila sp. EB88]|uniref:hypothetical protein n=1 Tax=Acidipila sp. EB88 TaxID=2305226 RepID=UPI000F5EE2F7|nr:hypothetical protein [Acidipila sp. EB88]RRA48243.1 hypothetical protein D1Y84_08020 [Acidipila sp. EB88]